MGAKPTCCRSSGERQSGSSGLGTTASAVGVGPVVRVGIGMALAEGVFEGLGLLVDRGIPVRDGSGVTNLTSRIVSVASLAVGSTVACSVETQPIRIRQQISNIGNERGCPGTLEKDHLIVSSSCMIV